MSSNEQFLFSCINHSNGGTINWQKVADECGVPSKGAAAIKFRRLKEKFGTATTASGAAGGDAEETPKKKTTTKKATLKKRKIEKDDDDDEEPDSFKAKGKQEDGDDE